MPKIDKEFFELMNLDYKELALYIMKKFFTDFEEGELKTAIERTYDEKFESDLIAPLVKKGDVFFLELYHGPTLAFKDMALSILPHLLTISAKKLKIKDEIVILTATSGDTGKAALEGFEGVEGTKIIVFYPEDGVSLIQKRQMITQGGNNTFVVGIKGNFDDAQKGVKEIFNDFIFNEELKERGYRLSSANSINIGRLIPQIVYYVYGYLQLLNSDEISHGEKINICVPTGNFGNILAAYIAKEMGLPVNKLICASNINNVLYEFFSTGIYDRRRDLKKTISPSMDILVSSNLERLLYFISGKDEKTISNLMTALGNSGVYEINDEMKEGLKDFYGGYATDEEAKAAINKVFKEYAYLIDPHTAVAYHVYEEYRNKTKDDTKTIISSTASPFKFTRSVMEAISGETDLKLSDFELIRELSKFANIQIPDKIKDIENRPVLHDRICEKTKMKETVREILLGR